MVSDPLRFVTHPWQSICGSRDYNPHRLPSSSVLYYTATFTNTMIAQSWMPSGADDIVTPIQKNHHVLLVGLGLDRVP